MTQHTPIKNRGFSFHTDNRDTFYNTLLEPAIDRLNLNKLDRERLDWVVSGKLPSHRLSMLNRNVHRMTYRTLSKSVTDFYQNVNQYNIDLSMDRRFYFLTACWDDGLTSAVEPVCNIYKMKQKVSQVLYKHRLSGICAVEASPYRKAILGFRDRPVWFHIHGIVWSDHPRFNHLDMMAAERHRFPNALNIPGLVLTTRADYVRRQQIKGFEVPHSLEDMTVGDLDFLIAYMLERPTTMKRPEQSIENPDRHKFAGKEDLCSGRLALQMARIWSMLTPYDTVFGINEGKIPRATFAQAMRDWDQANRRKTGGIEPVDIELLWTRVAKRNPQAGLGKCQLTLR